MSIDLQSYVVGLGAAVRARSEAFTIPLQSGLLATVSAYGLLAPVVFSKTSGSANLTINPSTGAITAAAALSSAETQTISGKATGNDGVVLPFTVNLTGQVVIPTGFSNSTQYYVGSTGLRWPNRASALTGLTPYLASYYANYVIRKSPPWVVPAGSSMLVALPSIYVQEQNANINEGLLSSDVTVTHLYINYVDALGVTRNVSCTLSNSGLLAATGAGGGIIATSSALPGDISPNTDICYGIQLSFAAGASFTASISGNIMTVTGTTTGTIVAGHLATCSGITSDLTAAGKDSGITGTVIQPYGTGGTTGTGGAGTYYVATSQTQSSKAFTSGAMLIGGPAAIKNSAEGNGTASSGGRTSTTSMASYLATKASLVQSGTIGNGSVGGFMYAPAFACFKGADGRPVILNDGDSISYGKGMDSSISPNGVMGIIEAMGFDTSSSTYRVPILNTGVAASSPQYTYSGDATYNASIAQYRRALIDQVTAINAAASAEKPWPYTHYICEHGTNALGSPYNTLATFTTMMQARWTWLKSWHNAPIIQTTMLQKGPSSDMFQTLANQTIQPIDQTTGVRFAWNDSLLSASPPAGSEFAINTYTPLGWDTTTNRDKIRKAPGAWVTDATDAGSGSTLVLASGAAVAPAVGMSIAIGGQARLIDSVAGTGPWTVTTTVGSSSGTYGARTAGTAVYQIYTADGRPSTTGLHWSAPAVALVAPCMATLKAQLGNWSG